MRATFVVQSSCIGLLGAVWLAGLSGCNSSTSIDISKLPAPVNVALPVTAGDATQIAAADALGRIGNPAVPALAGAL